MRPLLDDQTRALFTVGFFRPMDVALFFILTCAGITVGFWKLFGNPTAIQLLCVLGLTFFLIQFWTIILVFRCCHQVVMARTQIATMPEAAARLAVLHQRNIT